MTPPTPSSVTRTRAYRARLYAEGWHYIRGHLTDAPRQKRSPGEEPPHGTVARYQWSYNPCRCHDCKAASATKARNRRARP